MVHYIVKIIFKKILASYHDKKLCGFLSQILFLYIYISFNPIKSDMNHVDYNHYYTNILNTFFHLM